MRAIETLDRRAAGGALRAHGLPRRARGHRADATTASARRSSRASRRRRCASSTRSSRARSRRCRAPTSRRSRRTCSAPGDKERAAGFAERAAEQAVVQARVRAGGAPLPAHAADHRARGCRDAPAEHAPGGGARVVGPRRRGGARLPRRGRAARRSASASSSNGRPPSSSSRADTSTRGCWSCAASSRRWGWRRRRPALGAALLVLVVYRALAVLRRACASAIGRPDEVSREDRVRVDALYSIGAGPQHGRRHPRGGDALAPPPLCPAAGRSEPGRPGREPRGRAARERGRGR